MDYKRLELLSREGTQSIDAKLRELTDSNNISKGVRRSIRLLKAARIRAEQREQNGNSQESARHGEIVLEIRGERAVLPKFNIKIFQLKLSDPIQYKIELLSEDFSQYRYLEGRIYQEDELRKAEHDCESAISSVKYAQQAIIDQALGGFR